MGTENRFILGDCLEMLTGVPDGSVDMVLCDLPYGATRNKWDSVIPFEPLWRHYWRVSKPNAAIVLTAQTPFDKALGFSQIQHLKYEWIWEKTSATGHMNAKKSPLKAHENILVFYKKLPTYNPIKSTGHKRKTATNKGTLSENYGKKTKQQFHYDSTERYPRSVVNFPKDVQTVALHPTQKPVALFEYLIKTYTNPGETVLDSCAGSGTTAIAALKTGRKYICMEKEPEYYLKAVERIKMFTNCET